MYSEIPEFRRLFGIRDSEVAPLALNSEARAGKKSPALRAMSIRRLWKLTEAIAMRRLVVLLNVRNARAGTVWSRNA